MAARSRALKVSVNESIHAIACDTAKDSLVSTSDAGKNSDAGLFMSMMLAISVRSFDRRRFR